MRLSVSPACCTMWKRAGKGTVHLFDKPQQPTVAQTNQRRSGPFQNRGRTHRAPFRMVQSGRTHQGKYYRVRTERSGRSETLCQVSGNPRPDRARPDAHQTDTEQLHIECTENTVQGHIEVYYETDTDGIRISVSDTGCGIPPDKLGMIFERFEKVDSFAQGAGLGLSICKSIVEKMNGVITVDSTMGVGSTFTVELPCRTRPS